MSYLKATISNLLFNESELQEASTAPSHIKMSDSKT